MAGVSCVAAGAIVFVSMTGLPRWNRGGSAAIVAASATRDPATLYAGLVKDGFEPYWKCEDDVEFARFTASEYGESFVVPQNERVHVLGWAYGRKVAGKDAGIILCRVDETPVVVLVNRLDGDRPIDVPAESGLKAHRRELGAVVLYELTPHEAAKVIPAAVRVEAVR